MGYDSGLATAISFRYWIVYYGEQQPPEDRQSSNQIHRALEFVRGRRPRPPVMDNS
jgi:hypothetical protein